MKKSFKIIFLLLFSFSLFAIYLVSPGQIYAEDSDLCPPGFVKDRGIAPQACCKGSDSGQVKVDWNSDHTHKVCMIEDSEGEPDESVYLVTYPYGSVGGMGVPENRYCGPDRYQLGGTCYKYKSQIDGKGYFLGCTSTVVVTAWKGNQSYEEDLGFCRGGDAVFADDTNVCVCADDPTNPVEAPEDDLACTETCGEDNVLYSPLGGSSDLMANPSVACTTSTGEPGIVTALGCIPTEQTGITNWVIRFGFFISGGLVVFRIIQGSIMIMTAVGNPDKIQEGKEIITSAIIGLLVVLSAVMLLEFIGVDFLGLQIEGIG